MWSMVGLIAAVYAVAAACQLCQAPEETAEHAGRIAAAFRRGLNGGSAGQHSTPPHTR